MLSRTLRIQIESTSLNGSASRRPIWDRLGSIYERLPGWLGYDPVPWWFGNDGTRPPYLSASVEPPGLQVTGVLPAGEFARWHEAFMQALAEFPFSNAE
jgi:hypothetical protein